MNAMKLRQKWHAFAQVPLVRSCLFALGCLLILLSPLVGALPGPGGVIVFAAGLASAAAQNGIVTGRVANAATGAYLESATVAVEGSTLQTVTARGGEFSLQVPPGRHTVVVAYTGLDTERKSVNVAAGGMVVENFALTSGVYKLDAVTVSGLREGSALAIQQQRLAENMKTVAATDSFGNPASVWFSDRSRQDIVVAALCEACEELRALGKVPIERCTWGRIHRLTLKHAFGQRRRSSEQNRRIHRPFQTFTTTLTIRNTPEVRTKHPLAKFQQPPVALTNTQTRNAFHRIG